MIPAEYLNVPSECQIISTRTFKAKPDVVFNAWSNPAILQKWWGPKGFTNTFKTFDFYPGGRWIFTMHGPEKGNYPNEVIFKTIQRPALIVWDRVSQPLFRVVTTLDETSDGHTNLVFRMQFDSKEACDKIRKFAPEKNEENFDKLEAVIENRSPE